MKLSNYTFCAFDIKVTEYNLLSSDHCMLLPVIIMLHLLLTMNIQSWLIKQLLLC